MGRVRKYDWKEIAKIAEMEAKEYRKRHGISPTLRGLFYILVSKNVIENTVQCYKTLSRVLAEKRYSKEFPDFLIRDVTRKSKYAEKETYYKTEEITLDEIKDRLESWLNYTYDVSLNVWEFNKDRVIVLVEKEAEYEAVVKMLSDFEYGVYSIRCMKGFDSATDVLTIAREVKNLNLQGYRAVLLLITDFDPSGEEIAEDVSRRLKRIDPELDFIAEKVMVTKEQVLKFNLPYRPESEAEIKKLQRDSRFTKFVSKHGLMRVELDALIGLRFNEAKEILINAILKYLSKDAIDQYNKKKEELEKQSSEIKQKVLEKIQQLFRQ